MVTRIGPKKAVRLYIAEWRNHRDLSQDQLANRIGATKSTISRWETGDRDILNSALAAIAEALNCAIEDLYNDPAMPSADALLRDMDDQTRRQAYRLIKALKTGTDE